jgi:hypothetical protein
VDRGSKYACSYDLVGLSLRMGMKLLTRVWVWGKFLLELLELVGLVVLVVLVVHLSLKLEFVQGIHLVVQGWQQY